MVSLKPGYMPRARDKDSAVLADVEIFPIDKRDGFREMRPGISQARYRVIE